MKGNREVDGREKDRNGWKIGRKWMKSERKKGGKCKSIEEDEKWKKNG